MYKSHYSNHITVYTDKDSSLILKKAGEALNNVLSEYKMFDVLLMLSGGSALHLLDFIEDIHIGKHLTVTTLDERFSKDPEINNFLQITKTHFFSKTKERGAQTISTITQDDTLKEAAERFEFELSYYLKKKPQSKIIITQGIGPDGHTAGIMPYPEDKAYFEKIFNSKDQLVVGYNAGNKNPYSDRITVTIPFLENNVDESIVYVSGENKAEALDKILQNEGEIHELPGLVTRNMKHVELYNDIVNQM